jgi:adenylate cyclase
VSPNATRAQAPLSLQDLRDCFEGAVPAVIATASADGIPNVTYLSRVRVVDDERVALSNQFFSKTVRNLAENPRASVVLIEPTTYDQYRLSLVYERTDRRGPVFERLREDVDAIAALQGVQDVFKLRSADIYRVVDIEPVLAAAHHRGDPPALVGRRAPDSVDPAAMAELLARLGRCPDLDTMVPATLRALAELFGFEHSLLLLLDEGGSSLYTLASRGYDDEGVGSEVAVGEGIIGMAAQRCAPMQVGNLQQMAKYSRTVRRSFEDTGQIGPGREIPVPGLAKAQSRVAVPAMAGGELVGVLTVEAVRPVAFSVADVAVLSAAASVVAGMVAATRAGQGPAEPSAAPAPAPGPSIDPAEASGALQVRFFPADGSTFLDGDYLIKGVAGRVLWSLLGQHQREGRTEFTNREVRLDPSLELPAFRDNLESRLILLKRRLEERQAPIRIEKTGRGRFRLLVHAPLRLESAGDAATR